MEKPNLISVIGPSESACTPSIYKIGLSLGQALLDAGFWVVCGGKGGLMEAVCKGAHQSSQYQFGCTIGMLPEIDTSQANEYCDIKIPTGLGISRNLQVVNTGEKVVAIAGASGTLSEIAFAWQLGKEIIAYQGLGGWAENLANQTLDTRRSDYIKSANSVAEIIQFLQS